MLEITEWRKGVTIWLQRKGGGLERQRNTQNGTFINFERVPYILSWKSYAICKLHKTKALSISTNLPFSLKNTGHIRFFKIIIRIAPTRNCIHLLKNVLNLFVCIKLNFFITIFLSLSDLFYIIRIRPAPGDHERKWLQFRVGAIPSEPL